MDAQSQNSGGNEFVKPEVVPPAQPPVQKIVLEQPGGMFGRFGKYLLIALVISVMLNLSQRAANDSYFTDSPKVREVYHSHQKIASNKVAIVTVEGALINGDGFIKEQIDQVRRDKSVKAVVLRINSPGGTVTASDYVYHHLKELTKEREIPLVVSMGGICASGGYYVAMAVGDQEDAIYAEPTTWTGSIGVIIPHYDASELLASWKIKDDSIASHKFKQLGSPTRQLSEEDRAEERAILQALVDDSFEGFKEVVRSGRPTFRDNDAMLDRVATGQIFTANQALDAGLVDQIGFIEAAIDRAIELAALPTDDVRVVEYKSKVTSLAELVMGSSAQSQFSAMGGVNLQQLLDLTAPRAYYLTTWLPALLTNTRP